jgi:hypothetical protein
MTSTLRRVLLAGAFAAVGLSAALAQPTSPRNHSGWQPGVPYQAVPTDGFDGNARGTAYGAGGSAGTHPTGANVGPGRAAMDHATGP